MATTFLHDVGYAPERIVHGFYAFDGARWLRHHSLERLADLLPHHPGARFEAEAPGTADVRHRRNPHAPPGRMCQSLPMISAVASPSR
jgi:hypothetical protein